MNDLNAGDQCVTAAALVERLEDWPCQDLVTIRLSPEALAVGG